MTAHILLPRPGRTYTRGITLAAGIAAFLCGVAVAQAGNVLISDTMTADRLVGDGASLSNVVGSAGSIGSLGESGPTGLQGIPGATGSQGLPGLFQGASRVAFGYVAKDGAASLTSHLTAAKDLSDPNKPVGNYNVTFEPGYFTIPPLCVLTTPSVDNSILLDGWCQATNPTAAGLSVICYKTTVTLVSLFPLKARLDTPATDTPFNVICLTP